MPDVIGGGNWESAISFHYPLEWQREERPLLILLTRCWQWVGEWGKANIWGYSLVLPSGQQEPNYMSHHCCFLGFALAGSWSQKPEAGIEPRHSSVGHGYLTHLAKHPLWNIQFLKALIEKFCCSLSVKLREIQGCSAKFIHGSRHLAQQLGYWHPTLQYLGSFLAPTNADPENQ